MDDEEIPTLVEVDLSKQVPLTIITGFLGSGKSTFLRYVLTERHGYRIAVIMNEFGDTADIESRAINISSDGAAEQSEEVLELANGCLCCSIKDSGAAAIERLMQRKGAFDYILLETTGLADPGPVASIFWQNEEYATGLGKDIHLDGVVCVVDAVFGEKQIEEDHSADGIGESLKQIAAADVILLNKVDLTPEKQVQELEDTIQKINPAAAVYRTIRGNVDLSRVIGIDAYGTSSRHALVGVGSEQEVDHEHGPDCHHDEKPHYEVRGISSLQVACPVLDDARVPKLDAWIRSLLWDHRLPEESDSTKSIDILRCKGIFHTASGDQYILQGVRNMYDLSRIPDAIVTTGSYGLPPAGKLVFIGRGLDEAVEKDFISWMS
ncbi:cobW-domain-containing protein [Punctularia strigosozonata HHB-11173 SS5]|uniref:cobW-domain-containing protein n=1 Tax=Punctularia strigosozonata (strain HHB-11173) TaxID=741275 RepID=UPI0004416323|nr:cobW-domain-containing protein [Punctularia strigosozonata HHB-11173 SS5]EIN12826.1 cobW-domain-containing protein [Punctularia strigosozonata HHB-11173 SS5]